MSAQMKPRFVITPELRAELDRISAEAQLEHELRLNRCETIPLVRRYRRVKKRPRTAIVSEAARQAVEKRGTLIGLHKFLYGKTAQ